MLGLTRNQRQQMEIAEGSILLLASRKYITALEPTFAEVSAAAFLAFGGTNFLASNSLVVSAAFVAALGLPLADLSNAIAKVRDAWTAPCATRFAAASPPPLPSHVTPLRERRGVRALTSRPRPALSPRILLARFCFSPRRPTASRC